MYTVWMKLATPTASYWKRLLEGRFARHYSDTVSQGLNAAQHGAQTSFAASTASCARSAPPARVRLITTRNSSLGSFPSATSSRSPITSAGVLPRKSRAWSSPLSRRKEERNKNTIHTHKHTHALRAKKTRCGAITGRLQELCRNKRRWVGETRKIQNTKKNRGVSAMPEMAHTPTTKTITPIRYQL